MSAPVLESPVARLRRDVRGVVRAATPERPVRPTRVAPGSPGPSSLPQLAPAPPRAIPASAVPGRPRRRRRRAALLTVAAALAVLATPPLVAAAEVVLTANEDARTPTDAIVVLGAARYWGDPSPVLQARLEHAAELHAAGVAPVIITVGAGRDGDRTTEADAGRDWLIAHGVPADDVLSVPRGGDTVGSLRSVAAVVSDLGWDSVTVVSDPAHAARAAAVADATGMAATVSPTRSGPGSGLTAEYVARETAALLRFELLTRWSLTDQRRVDPAPSG